MAKRFLTPIQLATLDEPPTNPIRGQIYFDNSEETIKAYNGQIWYDVAGPKNILDHRHTGANGIVDSVEYSNYVDDGRIFADGGADLNSLFVGNSIDGGGA